MIGLRDYNYYNCCMRYMELDLEIIINISVA